MKPILLFKVILGFMALSFATVGLFLPVLPTTPFVLLAIGCFSSTPRLRSRLLRIACFREYYESYTSGKGVCRKTVAASLAFLWVMLTISMVLVAKTSITLLLLAVGVGVTVHILYISKDRAARNRLARRTSDED